MFKNVFDSHDLSPPVCNQYNDLGGELFADSQQATASSAVCEKAVHLQQKSKELQERLMVSEATVQAQAEQLKDYRDLLSEWTQTSHLSF